MRQDRAWSVRIAVIAVVGACGRIGFDSTGGDATPDDAVVTTGPFGPAVQISELAGPGATDDPTLSADMLEIYFDSNRPGGVGGGDIWRSRRASLGGPWQTPQVVLELSETSDENTPELAPDGLSIYFARTGMPGPLDIYVSTRADRDSPWTAPMPVTELNSGNTDVAPTPASNLRLYFARSISGLAEEIHVATRTSPQATWFPPLRVTELSDPARDTDPFVDASDTTIYWGSHRGGGSSELWRALRPSPGAPFADIAPMSELDLPGTSESDPWLSPDGRTLYFSSENGVTGAIYMATRP